MVLLVRLLYDKERRQRKNQLVIYKKVGLGTFLVTQCEVRFASDRCGNADMQRRAMRTWQTEKG